MSHPFHCQAYYLQSQAPHLLGQYSSDINQEVQTRLGEFEEVKRRARSNIRNSLKLPPSQVGGASVQKWGSGVSRNSSVGSGMGVAPNNGSTPFGASSTPGFGHTGNSNSR